MGIPVAGNHSDSSVLMGQQLNAANLRQLNSGLGECYSICIFEIENVFLSFFKRKASILFYQKTRERRLPNYTGIPIWNWSFVTRGRNRHQSIFTCRVRSTIEQHIHPVMYLYIYIYREREIGELVFLVDKLNLSMNYSGTTLLFLFSFFFFFDLNWDDLSYELRGRVRCQPFCGGA